LRVHGDLLVVVRVVAVVLWTRSSGTAPLLLFVNVKLKVDEPV
jgi:hypothetical protein